MPFSACGNDCEECPSYNTDCPGCLDVLGKTFWAENLANNICPLYNCAVNHNHFHNCGACDNLPCDKFKELKDPYLTPEEHLKNIKDRVNRLKEE